MDLKNKSSVITDGRETCVCDYYGLKLRKVPEKYQKIKTQQA